MKAVRVIPFLLLAATTPLHAAPHSDDWCAEAVDYAMGAAQNREVGYTLEVLTGSVDRNAHDYRRMFPALSGDDMKRIAAQVFERGWSRFRAAQGIAESCEVVDAPR